MFLGICLLFPLMLLLKLTTFNHPSLVPGKKKILLMLSSWIHAEPPLTCDIIMMPALLMTRHQSGTVTPWSYGKTYGNLTLLPPFY